MSGDKAFFDTNVLLYLVGSEEVKARRAEALLAKGGVVTVQVMNEFASVASRKLKMAWPEIREILWTVRAICRVDPVSIELHERGLLVAERYRYSIYDGLIIAGAAMAGCLVLYSEDMQDGQSLEGLTIQNPFRA